MHSHVWRMWRTADIDRDVPLPKGLVRRIVSFSRPYHGAIRLLTVGILVGAVLGVAPPLIVKEIFDKALKLRSLSQLNILVLGLVGVAVLSAVVGVGVKVLTAKIAEGLIFDLRVSLFGHIQRLPIQFFTRSQTGSLVSRLNNDVVTAQRAVSETYTWILQMAVDLVITLGTMFALEWRLTLMVLAVMPLLWIPSRLVGKRLENTIRRQMQTNAAMNVRLTERFQVGGALLVKLFGNLRREHEGFSENAARVRDLGIKTTLYSRVFYVSFSLVAALGTALVYWLGGRMVIRGGPIELGTIVAFSLLLSRLYSPLRSLSDVPVEIKTALVAFDRVFEIMDFPAAISEKASAVDLVDAQGRIEFKDVWFRYPSGEGWTISSLEEGGMEAVSDQWILSDVSFVVEPGQMVALVGPSGAGKTTISMLVPRLYDVTKGEVQIDGHDVRQLTMQSLSDAVGMVTQDPHLFHDSIRANLLYAKPDASEPELIEACRAARIYELIDGLPDRFETMVGERGYRLSGGEKQRLAIARLLLKDPAIMILDEATAHLDSESEMYIKQALAEALSGRSSLVIAHRLSTVVNADQLLVVEAGKIVERGSHWELLDRCGLYSELYHTQFARGESARPSLPAAAGAGRSIPGGVAGRPESAGGSVADLPLNSSELRGV